MSSVFVDIIIQVTTKALNIKATLKYTVLELGV